MFYVREDVDLARRLGITVEELSALLTGSQVGATRADIARKLRESFGIAPTNPIGVSLAATALVTIEEARLIDDAEAEG